MCSLPFGGTVATARIVPETENVKQVMYLPGKPIVRVLFPVRASLK